MAISRSEVSLQDVIVHLEQKQAPELYGGLLIVAQVIVEYFRQPAFEIMLSAIKKMKKLKKSKKRHNQFPLYLSYRRISSEQEEAIAWEVNKLIEEGDALQRSRSKSN
jgi:hypothetical protein